MLQRHASILLGNPLTPYDQAFYDRLLQWSQDVINTLPADLDSIHNLLVDSPMGVPGALTLCASAFQQKWASDRGNAFPLDDRQYFNNIRYYLSTRQLYQSFAVR